MWRATVNGVLARKVRLLLTALAVVLGVAFATGTYVLTDTLHSSVQQLFRQYTAGSDLIVRFHEPFAGGGGTRERIPEGVVTDVRSTPGVAAADGFVQGDAQFVAKNGKHVIQTAGFPTLGISWSRGARAVGPARIVSGRPPANAGEVAMDAGTAKREGFRVGDTVRVLATEAPATKYRIVGTFGLGNRNDLGVFSVAAFDTATAQRLFNAEGLVDWVNVRVKPGASVADVQTALSDRLGGQFDVDRAATVATQLRQPADEFLTILNYVLLAFAAAGVLVGGFIIFNTFTILVAQRTRELGLLRAMGASTTQVVGSVLIEAVAMGVLASALGFLAGIGLAKLMLVLLPHLGFHVVVEPLRVLWRTVWAAALVGVGATVLAAVYPAIRAARTPPVAAIADLRVTRSRPLVRRAIFGALIVAIGIGIGVWGLAGDLGTQYAVAVTFVGGFVVFVGIIVLGPLAARRLSSWVGSPLPGMLGVTGTLARGNAMRNPRRTNATAAALIIGLALVALVAIFAESFRTSIRSAVDDVRADYVISAPQLVGFSPRVATEAGRVPGVARTVSFRFDTGRIGTTDEIINGVSPKGLDDVVNLRFTEGGSAGLERGGILVSKQEADHFNVHVGDELDVEFPRTGIQQLLVSGIYQTRRFSGVFPIDFIVSDDLFDSGFGGGQQDTLVYVKTDSGSADAVGKALKQELAKPFPNVQVKTRAEFLAAREQTINQFLDVFIALLLLSELIAVLGIINTLMLSVYERTRELGLLRTVGTTRGQIWTMVCGESVIIAIIGCFVGIAVGLLWGWGVTTALRGEFVDRFSVPPLELGWFVVASVVAGLLAALLPAWHASRLDVLEAVAQE
ncbi:MAG TPA: FtsX-like permease family protein [Acidimicrobiia bacterium]